MTTRIGLGDVGLRTRSLSGGASQQIAYPGNVFEFEYTEAVEQTFAKRQVAGKLTDEESLGGTTTRRLKLIQQVTDLSAYGLLYNQQKKSFTGLTMPVYKEAEIAGDGTIADADIVSGNISSVVVSYASRGSKSGPLTPSGTAPSAAGQFQAAAGTLTFHEDDAGITVGYFVDKTYASGKGYGGPGVSAKIGELEFVGKTFDTVSSEASGLLWLPRIERLDGVTLSYKGSEAQLEYEFNVLIPTGWTDAFLDLDLRSVA